MIYLSIEKNFHHTSTVPDHTASSRTTSNTPLYPSIRPPSSYPPTIISYYHQLHEQGTTYHSLPLSLNWLHSGQETSTGRRPTCVSRCLAQLTILSCRFKSCFNRSSFWLTLRTSRPRTWSPRVNPFQKNRAHQRGSTNLVSITVIIHSLALVLHAHIVITASRITSQT